MKKLDEVRIMAEHGKYRIKQNGDLYSDGYFIGSLVNYRGELPPRDLKNGELIAHCMNNFQPLLEALNGMVIHFEDIGDEVLRPYATKWIQESRKAIEAAENVEVI